MAPPSRLGARGCARQATPTVTTGSTQTPGARPGLRQAYLSLHGRDHVDGERLAGRDDAEAGAERLDIAPVGEVLADQRDAPALRLVGELGVEGDEGWCEIEIVEKDRLARGRIEAG